MMRIAWRMLLTAYEDPYMLPFGSMRRGPLIGDHVSRQIRICRGAWPHYHTR